MTQLGPVRNWQQTCKWQAPQPQQHGGVGPQQPNLPWSNRIRSGGAPKADATMAVRRREMLRMVVCIRLVDCSVCDEQLGKQGRENWGV